jgi:drug/metabolite transporter (DMT)-like permease
MAGDSAGKTKAFVAGGLFSVLVGFTFLAVKVMAVSSSALVAMVWRFNFAFLGLAFLFLLGKGSLKILSGQRPLILVLQGVLYTLFMLFQAMGLMKASSAEGGILFAAIPVFVTFFGWALLGEMPRLVQWVCIAASALSLSLLIVLNSLSLGGVQFNLLSFIFLLLSSMSLAGNITMMRFLRDYYSPLEIAESIIFVGFILFNLIFLAMLLFEKIEPSQYIAPIFSLKYILAGAYLGIVCVLGTSQLSAYTARRLTAVQTSMFGNLSTLISIIAGALLMRETLAYYHYALAAVIIGCVVMISASGGRKK